MLFWGTRTARKQLDEGGNRTLGRSQYVWNISLDYRPFRAVKGQYKQQSVVVIAVGTFSKGLESLFSIKDFYGFINIYIFAELYIFFSKDSEFLIHIYSLFGNRLFQKQRRLDKFSKNFLFRALYWPGTEVQNHSLQLIKKSKRRR